MTLIEQLKKFWEEDPNDPFSLYAYALEYQKHDQNKAAELFDLLINQHKNYLPAYYQAGLLYQDLGKREKALGIFLSGIEKAKEQKEMKTLRELQSAHDNLLYE